MNLVFKLQQVAAQDAFAQDYMLAVHLANIQSGEPVWVCQKSEYLGHYAQEAGGVMQRIDSLSALSGSEALVLSHRVNSYEAMSLLKRISIGGRFVGLLDAPLPGLVVNMLSACGSVAIEQGVKTEVLVWDRVR